MPDALNLSEALDQIDDGFIVYDRAWRVLYMNRAAEEYFGRARSELVGRVIWDEFPAAVGTEGERVMRQAADASGPSEFEMLAPAMKRWVAFRVFPHADQVSVSFRDVTEKRTIAEALRASEARYRALFEHALDGVFLTAPTGEILAANEAACAMLGRTAEEICAGGRAAVVDESDPRLPAALEERRRTGHVRAELTCIRGDGTRFPAELASAVYEDAQGRQMTSLTMRDLTEQKRAEDRLRLIAESGAILGSTLDLSATLADLTRLVAPRIADYCVVDLVEDGTLRRVAGAHRDPARRNAIMSVGAPGPVLHKDAGIYKVARTGEEELVPVVDEAWLRATTRDEAHFEVARANAPRSAIVVPLVGRRGGVLGVMSLLLVEGPRRYDRSDLATARAIADRAGLAIENARLHEQTVQAKRLRDEMLGVVSHDLRNPLHTILISARLLGKKTDAPEAQAIARAVGHANVLIQDLLTVAALEAGAMPLEKGRERVGAIVDEAIALHRALAADRSLVLESTVAQDLPLVDVDRHRILQVLDNLLGNALKFTPAGGTIRVDARRGEGAVVVAVSDSGPGIPAEALPHVFDRFWQGRTARRAGAGLGLAIVKGIVDAHGGTITAASEPGQGARFVFSIPLTPEPRTPAP